MRDSISIITSEITTDLWFKSFPLVHYFQVLIGFQSINIFLNSSTISVDYTTNQDTYLAFTSANLTENQWIHIALTINPIVSKFYLLQKSNSWTREHTENVIEGNEIAESMQNITNFYIGGNDTNCSFNGFIKNVRVWNSSLSQRVIEAYTYK